MNEGDYEDRVGKVVFWVCLILVLCSLVGGISMFSYLFVASEQINLASILASHFIAVFGLPGAAAAAFIIVTLFRQGEAPIKIKLLGVNMEGAAGPVVLWIFCFLALCVGMKLLW